MSFKTEAKFVKVDHRLGVILGWAIVCTENGERYFDKQGHHIEEEGMLEASSDFMGLGATLGEMHKSEAGKIVYCWPITKEICKAFGWPEPKRTGLLVGVKPVNKSILEKADAGEYSGFSIGGEHIELVDAD